MTDDERYRDFLRSAKSLPHASAPQYCSGDHIARGKAAGHVTTICRGYYDAVTGITEAGERWLAEADNGESL